MLLYSQAILKSINKIRKTKNRTKRTKHYIGPLQHICTAPKKLKSLTNLTEKHIYWRMVPESHRSCKSPNVLVIVVDCLRADRCPADPTDTHLRCWPQLRRSGTYFTQMISTASVTPVCFASLLTGQYSFAHGIRTISGPAINPDMPTLATILQQKGYHTHAYLTGPLTNVFGLDRGFDHYQCRPKSKSIYTDWGQKLFKQLSTILENKPWFVLLHLFELHYPRVLNKAKARDRSSRRYDLAWLELDEQLDRIIKMVPPNTLVILTADHGDRFSRESDLAIHTYIYRKIRKLLKMPLRTCDGRDHGFHIFEDLVRIPFSITGPGVPAGKVIDNQVSQVDLMPTILDLLGQQPPIRTHGRSLAALMDGKQLPDISAFIESGNYEQWRNWRGLRKNRWKYAEHPSDDTQQRYPELYDLHTDPAEKTNIIQQHPQIAQQMREEIEILVQDNPLGPGAAGRTLDDEEQARLNDQLRALGYL